ncbi:IS66 family insertion sequence element accessory protein TnpB [Streptococcus pneumoniae]|uniref:IS66 family insertion sequence element accessory protein TnpB n=2 Tax=Streptococcus pneumoniae TaxID=1313 RepID=UPI00355C9170
MNKALWKDLELKKISKQELVNTRFSRLFSHFGQEKDGSFLAQRYQFYLAQQGQTLSGAHDLLDSLIERDYDLYAATNGITAIQTGVKTHFELDPFSGQVFLFCGGRKDRFKALYWDGQGFWLLYKRFENVRLTWPSTEKDVKALTPEQVDWLMKGFSITPQI